MSLLVPDVGDPQAASRLDALIERAARASSSRRTNRRTSRARRAARPSLTALAHAVLIAYPRYFDPVTGMACPPEVALERLATDTIPRPGVRLRALAKLQGWFAGHAHLWR